MIKNKQYILIIFLLTSTPSVISPSILPNLWWLLGPSQQQEELMAAILMQHVEKTASLLKSGANPNFIDPVTKNSPLGVICASVTMNIDTKKKFIKLLCDYAVNVNMLNSFGKTPLIQAIKTGDCHLIEMLLTIGADPQYGSIEIEGHTLNALAYAHYLDRKDIIIILENYGAPDLTNQQRDNLTMALNR